MKEIVIISGKGGTGKTSLVAAFAAFAENKVLADCDVDAADLHLLLRPEVRVRLPFTGGRQAVIQSALCKSCGTCAKLCRFGAIAPSPPAEGRPGFRVDPLACEGCGVCVRVCPVGAIHFPERRCGEWMVSDTRCGPMVHARLGAAAENSGKLVSAVRREARRVAESEGLGLILVDGPPGIGCPAVASITGADSVLVVTEPTVAGEHDLERVLALTRHFGIASAVCVNKWDINPESAARMEATAVEGGARLVGKIRYDPVVTRAQLEGKTALEVEAPCARDIREMWNRLQEQGSVCPS